MKLFRVIAAMLFLGFAVSAGAAGRPEKVVYHISDASNAMQALAGQNELGLGRLTLRTRTLRQFTIGHIRHRLVARIEIIDNGPGIPAELQNTLFYPMVSGRPDGTGLGLAITQNIISQHQGLIECESHPGHTVFSIFLPLEQGATSA